MTVQSVVPAVTGRFSRLRFRRPSDGMASLPQPCRTRTSRSDASPERAAGFRSRTCLSVPLFVGKPCCRAGSRAPGRHFRNFSLPKLAPGVWLTAPTCARWRTMWPRPEYGLDRLENTAAVATVDPRDTRTAHAWRSGRRSQPGRIPSKPELDWPARLYVEQCELCSTAA